MPPVPLPVAAVPLILADFSSEPYSLPMLRSVAAALAPSCDAVLVGEHQNRPDFPPALHASLLLEAGVRPWMTLACRDRNRIVLERLLQKQRAGAAAAVLNHAAVATVTGFMAAAAQAGVTIPVIAGVAVFTDGPSAAVLSELPGLELDPAAVRRVLGHPDPVAAGITAAAREAQALLAIPGVVGVNLSGLASARGYEFAARIKAELAQRIRVDDGHDQ